MSLAVGSRRKRIIEDGTDVGSAVCLCCYHYFVVWVNVLGTLLDKAIIVTHEFLQTIRNKHNISKSCVNKVQHYMLVLTWCCC